MNHKLPEMFGSMVFNEDMMRQRLPKETYKVWKAAMERGKRLDLETANTIANSMKDWAIEKGATHYTHWFQPMTGVTAEKHDSFLSPKDDGGVIMEFRGKELIKGEPDASSFPSGGLRATFEARGYTAWDPTSYAFIKDDTLCIPTAFCSYGGQALDKKTPLLRSMEALNKQALRVLKLFGNEDVERVSTTAGPEQEYFLIDKTLFDKRKDLRFTGRTLFGAPAPKGQEMDDHYYGTIKTRVKAFMKDLDEELWKLGVYAKTEHNEAAPAQQELAPIFTTTNIAADHNQLTMEVMKKVALRHNFVCLLHEKPFAGVNGSGKHNNWSLATDTGINLLEPGETPYENIQFLLFLSAVIRAVDEYQDLLRVSVASAGNDNRLGGDEAPPAIVSMYLGEELTGVLEALCRDLGYTADKTLMKVGVHVLPTFAKDTTDRNRTSPFAFTGNKFEFRMLGSSASISGPNVVLNTIVADVLSDFADVLEKSENDFNSAVHDLICETYLAHKRIIFNGNNYSEEWVKEAEERGLLNLKTTVDALPHYVAEKNVALFARHKVYSEEELTARYEIKIEKYCKVTAIEAATMLEMAKKEILPAALSYTNRLAETCRTKLLVDASLPCLAEKKLIGQLSNLCDELYREVELLEKATADAQKVSEPMDKAISYKDHVLPAMETLRKTADSLETIMADDARPFPGYGDLLFTV
ncbi:MAG: glutamine synthetase III [Oscillospiraceae bacterium]|nr:glutamine synthetase III [Oscillospiraceae bacterium]